MNSMTHGFSIKCWTSSLNHLLTYVHLRNFDQIVSFTDGLHRNDDDCGTQDRISVFKSNSGISGFQIKRNSGWNSSPSHLTFSLSLKIPLMSLSTKKLLSSHYDGVIETMSSTLSPSSSPISSIRFSSSVSEERNSQAYDDSRSSLGL